MKIHMSKKCSLVVLLIILTLTLLSVSLIFVKYCMPTNKPHDIDENEVENYVNNYFSNFTNDDYLIVQKIFEDVYTQRKTKDHWPEPSDEGRKNMAQLDSYANFLFPKPLIIGETEDNYGISEVADKEEVGMLCEFGYFRPESCRQVAHYGLCFFYDSSNVERYVGETYTPYYYYHPLCINQLYKANDYVYIYIYYTTDHPNE